MSPAIMFCGARTTLNASRGFPLCQILLSASSFCLIGVLIGVGARDFLCSAYSSFGSFFHTENKHRALSRAPTQQLRVQPSAAATSAVLGVLSPTVLTDAVWLQGQARRR